MLLILVFTVLLASCSKSRELPDDAVAEIKQPLTWTICVKGLNGDNSFFNNSRIGMIMARQMPEIPQIRFSTRDATEEFSLLYASGTLPDLFTAETQDEVIRLCRKKTYSYAADEVMPTLSQAIPPEIKSIFKDYGHEHGIPGGFVVGDKGKAFFSEGIYVRKKYLNGKLNFNKPEFIQLLTETTSKHHDRDTDLANKQQINPILLDTYSKPFRTLEHLFGIRHYYSNGEKIGHRIFEDNWMELLEFLKEAGNATQHNPLLKSNDLQSALKNPDIKVYVGCHDSVAYANMELSYEEQFIPICPKFSESGFLQCYSKYGQYMTFICRNGMNNQYRAADCLKVLLTEELGRIAVFGEEKKDWVYDEGKEAIVLLSDRKTDYEKMQHGILCFPFLSSVGLGSKGYESSHSTFDILSANPYVSQYSDDWDNYYLYSLEQKIEEALTEIVEKGGFSNQDLKGVLTRLRQSNELFYLKVGIP